MKDIDKIVKYLSKYKVKLDDYKWKTRLEGLIKLKELNVIDDISELNSDKLSCFQKDEKLKEILSEELKKRYSESEKKPFNDLALWIIRDWGGIHGGDVLETLKLVHAFIVDERPKFERIASASKVGGFMFPQQNIIYDSRVSYTVNWIILSQNIDSKFFPIPEGRNSKMNAFDLNVLIRLHHIDKYKNTKENQGKNYISEIDKSLFINKDDAYFEMNKLICEVNQVLWSDDSKRKKEPFYTEMLLFSMADTIVFDEITKLVSLRMI